MVSTAEGFDDSPIVGDALVCLAKPFDGKDDATGLEAFVLAYVVWVRKSAAEVGLRVDADVVGEPPTTLGRRAGDEADAAGEPKAEGLAGRGLGAG